jgi:hypothetical protein
MTRLRQSSRVIQIGLLDRSRDEGAESLDRGFVFAPPPQMVGQRFEVRGEVREDDVLLRWEVAEERPWRDVGGLGDVGDRRLLEAPLIE